MLKKVEFFAFINLRSWAIPMDIFPCKNGIGIGILCFNFCIRINED